MVRAKLITHRGTEVPIEARMLRRVAQWLIYDVTIESVSLIANYRTQFDRIIRTASYQELLRKLKENRDQLLNERPAPTGRSS